MPETHATRFPVSRFSPSVRLLLRLVDGFSLPENAHTSCALAAAGGGVYQQRQHNLTHRSAAAIAVFLPLLLLLR